MFKKLELLYIHQVGQQLHYTGVTDPGSLHGDLWTSCFPALSWLCFNDGLLCLKNVDKSTISIDFNKKNEFVIHGNPAGDLSECYKDIEDYHNHVDKLFRGNFSCVTKLTPTFFLEESDSRLLSRGKPCVFKFASIFRAPRLPDYYRGVWPLQQRAVLVSTEKSREPLRPPAVLEASASSVSSQTGRSLRPRKTVAKYKEDSDEDRGFEAAPSDEADSDYEDDINSATTCRYCSVHKRKQASK